MKWGTFVDSEGLGFFPQLFLMAAYGYILFQASNTISEGSEMLLAIYGPGIVGGLLIPILGAVPDAAIILVSGLGPRDQVQSNLSIGVGTLAGSSIMLLTIPWALGVYYGRRDLDESTGEARAPWINETGKKVKLSGFSWTKNVVTTDEGVPRAAKIMILSSLSFLLIQIPAFFDKGDKNASKEERPFAITGFIVSLLGFIAYSAYQLLDARYSDFVEKKHREAERTRWKSSLAGKFRTVDAFSKVFHNFDLDKSGFLERAELQDALSTLGLQADRQEVAAVLKDMDQDKDGRISEGEFTSVIVSWINKHSKSSLHQRRHSSVMDVPELDSEEAKAPPSDKTLMSPKGNGDIEMQKPFLNDSELEDEEDDDDEEEYIELTDSQLLKKGVSLLLLGTLMVTIFSDPMVEVINNFGNTIGVPPFYVSFVVTPLASNASEVISALVFAKKKSQKGISLTFSSLYGAATMNNTLGLSVFMALVFLRDLVWAFSAEVISILTVISIVGFMGRKKTVNLRTAAIVGSLFPLSILLVWFLENVCGLD